MHLGIDDGMTRVYFSHGFIPSSMISHDDNGWEIEKQSRFYLWGSDNKAELQNGGGAVGLLEMNSKHQKNVGHRDRGEYGNDF